MSRTRLHILVALGLGAAAPYPAPPVVVVTGGVDSMMGSDLTAEFATVPAGQQFATAVISSLAAQEGFLNNDCTFGVLQNCTWSPLGANSPVDLAVSLVPLTDAQVNTYNAGLGAADGPPIQFPLYGISIAIPYVNSALKTNGMLVLGDGELCGILSGQITDWSQFSYLAAPGPFQIVYDADASSGATWLLTQHLAAVCDATNSVFTTLPVPVTTDFSSLPVPGGVAGNSHFVGAANPAAVQAALLGATSAIGYLPTNYTSVASRSPVTSPLVVAALYNPADAKAFTPTITNVTLALNNPGANAINAAPPATRQQAADPTNWVPQLPTPSAGYPIVGYANWIFSTCYLSVAPQIIQYLTAPLDLPKHLAIAAKQGFVQLSAASPAYATAVANILLSNQDGFNLQMQNPVACGGRVEVSP